MTTQIRLLDLRNLEEFERKCEEMELGEDLPEEAQLMGWINWASTAPGIDWPESYYVERRLDRWIAWAECDFEASPVERSPYVFAWSKADVDEHEFGEAALEALWRYLKDQGQERFEFALSEGSLSASALRRIADRVWGG